MAKNTSFALNEHFVEFIHDQVENGRFATASEVVREGLRLLEDREVRIARLRAAIQEGIDSGPGQVWTSEELLASIKKRADGLGKL